VPPSPESHKRQRNLADRGKTAMQVFAILCLVAYFALLAYKGTVDFSALAQKYPGDEFWPALGRHLIRNLGGG